MTKPPGIYSAICLLAWVSASTLPARGEDARSLFLLGGQRMEEGRCEEATDLMLRAARVFEAEPGTEPEQLAVVWQSLGSAYRCLRLFSKAEHAYQRSLDRAPFHRALEVLASLASVYYNEGRYLDASATLARAWEQLQASPGAPDPLTLVLMLNNGAAVEQRTGRTAEAEAHLRQALTVMEKAGDPDPATRIRVVANLAKLRSEQKDNGEAAALCSKAVGAGASAVLPPAPLAAIAESCAVAMRRAGEKAEAKRLHAWAKQLAASDPRQPSDGLLVDARGLVLHK